MRGGVLMHPAIPFTYDLARALERYGFCRVRCEYIGGYHEVGLVEVRPGWKRKRVWFAE